MIVVDLLYKKDKVLAQKVSKILSGMNDRKAEQIVKMLEISQDPVQRIAEGRSYIERALIDIINYCTRHKIDPHLLVSQKEKVNEEIQTIQNIIRSVLGEKNENLD